MSTQNKRRLIRRKEIEQRTGMSRSTIYRKIAAGTFPAPIQLSARMVAWHEDVIDAWVDAPEW